MQIQEFIMNWAMEKERLSLQKHFTVEDLRSLVQILRSPEGCDWDREQTHASIRECLLNEAQETVEAIDQSNSLSLKEELGDLLFQVIFHSAIAEEEGAFTMDDVVDDICKKMLFRHPHVFRGTDKPDWDVIKAQEKSLRAQAKW